MLSSGTFSPGRTTSRTSTMYLSSLHSSGQALTRTCPPSPGSISGSRVPNLMKRSASATCAVADSALRHVGPIKPARRRRCRIGAVAATIMPRASARQVAERPTEPYSTVTAISHWDCERFFAHWSRDASGMYCAEFDGWRGGRFQRGGEDGDGDGGNGEKHSTRRRGGQRDAERF